VAPFAQFHLLKASSQLSLLADCEPLSRVRGLSLSYSYLNDGSVQVLAGLPQLAGLRVLLLDHNFIRGPGAEALLRSPDLSGLKRLNLRGNQFTAASRQGLIDRFGPALTL
jgi:hypothetical protein